MTEAVIIVRDRYQITIPDLIRHNLSWLAPGKAIRLKLNKTQLLLESYEKKTVNWTEILNQIKAIRKSMGNESLTAFVIKDRENRR
jgi:bifunctional DNA-binding transcriptional regulator/antitoxin component of YhaV-PrlF toxin-antitoxin module